MNIKSLELKIPPVALTIIFAVLMWMFTLFTPEITIFQPIKVLVVLVLILIGSIISILGVWEFKQSKTTVNPMTPEESSLLVTSGVYSRTRNPMYVGFLCFLLAWGMFLANVLSLIFCSIFIFYMNNFQIKPEERALVELFGEEYSNYKQSVRRWL